MRESLPELVRPIESLTQTSADLTNVAKRKINVELANKISNILLHA